MTKLKPNQINLDGNIITEVPILFQGELIRANLEGRKSQTRRCTRSLNRIPKNAELYGVGELDEDSDDYGACFMLPDHDSCLTKKSPYGKPGDLIWVRETWMPFKSPDHQITKYDYRANWSEGITSHPKNAGIWKPSIHMPKDAARIWLMLEELGMERCQDISEADAIAEGVRSIDSDNPLTKGYFNYNKQDFSEPNYYSPINSFHSLWIKINGEASFEANPWVWVVKYRILSTDGRPDNDTILQNHLEITRKEVAHV